VRRDAVEMRELIASEKPPANAWDLKLVPGGIIDLEFIAQVATLTGKVEAGKRVTETSSVLAALSPDFAAHSLREELVAAHGLYQTLTQVIRLCLTGPMDPDDIPPGLADLMLGATDLPDMAVLSAHVTETARKAKQGFDHLLRGKRG
jgi:glutamate-ammonia-ligase adenylyltransferase